MMGDVEVKAGEFDLSDRGSLMLGTDFSYRTESYTNSYIDLSNGAAAEAQTAGYNNPRTWAVSVGYEF